MKQDRAPPVRPYYSEPAVSPARKSPGRGRTARCHHDKDRPQGRIGPDTRTYHKGVKVSNAQMAKLHITGDAFHPEWNYTELS
ncbi:hypothetical protein HFO30_36115 [Rhizobium laguerreae]|nr:hypothetical protein [Rhizobium laguerreae]